MTSSVSHNDASDSNVEPDAARPIRLQSSLCGDVFWTFGQQCSSLFVGILTSVVLARSLGPAQFGVYRIAVLVPIVAALLLDVGFSQAHVYFVGSGRVSLRSAVRFSTVYTIAVSILVAFVTVLLIYFDPTWLPAPLPTGWLLVALAATPVFLLGSLLRSLLQASHRFAAYNRSAFCAAAMMLLLVLAVTLTGPLALSMVLLCLIASQGSGVLLAASAIRRQAPSENIELGVTAYGKLAVSYGWKIHLSLLVNFLSYRLDIVLLTYFAGPAAAGVYYIAVGLLERIGAVSQAVQTVVFPRIAGTRDPEAMRAFVPKVNRCVTAATVGLVLLLAAAGWPLILLLYGLEYTGAYCVMLAMMPGIVALSASRSLASDLLGRDRATATLVASVCGFLANVAFNLWLIPTFGGIGAAIATSISYSLMAVIIWFSYLRIAQVAWWLPLLPRLSDLIELARLVPFPAICGRLGGGGRIA